MKNIDFGMAYGMSKYKLAGDMKWPIKRAEDTINGYFRLFPALKGVLNFYAWHGLTEGYITTIAPFFRKRWFPDAKFYSREEIEAHWTDVKFNKRLGQIERAAKNMPIQGSSADITKLAMVLLYHEIHDNQLEHKVHLTLQVHDANMTAARTSFVEEWSLTQNHIMNEAAPICNPQRSLLRTETDHSPVWKNHDI